MERVGAVSHPQRTAAAGAAACSDTRSTEHEEPGAARCTSALHQSGICLGTKRSVGSRRLAVTAPQPQPPPSPPSPPPSPPKLMPAPDLAGARSAAVVRHDLPLKYAGKGDALAREDADLRPGSLRVSILEAEGLPSRPDGSACRPHVVISIAELTRRRCRRTMSLTGPTPEWNESFDLDEVGGSGQVVVDLWDAAEGSGEPDLMGKAVVSLDECRPGVPHTFFKNMLVGKLVFRVLFDHGDLPDATEEAAQVQQSLATALS